MEDIKKEITILWLDDVRDPLKHFKKKHGVENNQTFIRNSEYYNNNVFNQYTPNFVWVKSYDEFVEYITKNGLPDMVSFDHDLGKGLTKGAECAKWLLRYCKETNQPLPKCYAHSANPNGRREINTTLGILSETISNAIKKALFEGLYNDKGL